MAFIAAKYLKEINEQVSTGKLYKASAYLLKALFTIQFCIQII